MTRFILRQWRGVYEIPLLPAHRVYPVRRTRRSLGGRSLGAVFDHVDEQERIQHVGLFR